MPTKTRTKTKTKPHAAAHDAERIAIQAGLKRAARREQEIQRLAKNVEKLALTSDLRLRDLAIALADRSGAKVIAGYIYDALREQIRNAVADHHSPQSTRESADAEAAVQS